MTRRRSWCRRSRGTAASRTATWDYWVSNDPKIAYVRITQFTPDTFDKLKAGDRRTR